MLLQRFLNKQKFAEASKNKQKSMKKSKNKMKDL